MEQARLGERAAFGELVRRHTRDAYRVAVRFLGDPSEAEDLVQASFLKILERLDGYQARGCFPAYLRTVVARTCLDWKAKRRPHPSAELDLRPSPPVDPGARQSLREEEGRVQAALDRLPPRQRLAMILRHYGECSYSSVAEVMEESPKAVENLLRRAREALSGFLRRKGEEK